MKVAEIRKAVVAGATALSTALALGLVPSPWDQWTAVLFAALGVYGVYAVPNEPKENI